MSDNRQRAEALAMLARHDDLGDAIAAVTEALDAAEARGFETALKSAAGLVDDMATTRSAYHNELDQTAAGVLNAAAHSIRKLADEPVAEAALADALRGWDELYREEDDNVYG